MKSFPIKTGINLEQELWESDLINWPQTEDRQTNA